MSDTLPEMILYAGEYTTWGVTVTDSDGAALDLTGSTVYFTAKRNLGEADSTAIIDIQQTSHTDAAGGLTTLQIDLRSVGERMLSKGDSLTGDIWVKDSAGSITPQGLIKVTVKPAATKAF